MLRVDAHFIEGQLAVEVGAAQQGLGDGVGLVVDFLFHEGRVAALLGRRRIPVHVVFLALGRGAEEVRDLHGVGGDGDDLVLAQLHGAARVVDEAGDVRAEEVLALAQAHHEGRVAPGSDDDVRLVRMHGQEGEGAFQALAGKLHGLGQAAVGGVTVQFVPEDVAQERGGHLGVRFGSERCAAFQQFQLELGVVFDDAVVDQGELPAVGQVRVRVLVGGSAVGGPAGVADSGERSPATDALPVR